MATQKVSALFFVLPKGRSTTWESKPRHLGVKAYWLTKAAYKRRIYLRASGGVSLRRTFTFGEHHPDTAGGFKLMNPGSLVYLLGFVSFSGAVVLSLLFFFRKKNI